MKPNWKAPFLDLTVPPPQRRRLLAAVERVLAHGRLVMGPEVSEFETRTAQACRREAAVGVSSGTDALMLALHAAGIGPGDEVITTSLSWIATANAIAHRGATPVFADINTDLNIDPESVRRLISPRTRALLPVHFTGRICDMETLLAIAHEHGLLVIEDASQAFGAQRHGRLAGEFGDLACFSANPMKVFPACGEAGFVVGDDDERMERIRRLRYAGTIHREECVEPGYNSRLDTLQAAILLERLPETDRIRARRRAIASVYRERFGPCVEAPREEPEERHAWYTFTIQTDRRDSLRDYLAERGVETKIQHAILMPQQPAFRNAAQGEWARAETLVQRILCLPASEALSDEQVEYVADSVRGFFEA